MAHISAKFCLHEKQKNTCLLIFEELFIPGVEPHFGIKSVNFHVHNWDIVLQLSFYVGICSRQGQRYSNFSLGVLKNPFTTRKGPVFMYSCSDLTRVSEWLL